MDVVQETSRSRYALRVLRRLLPAIVALVLLTIAIPAPAFAIIPPDLRCRSGEVSLTFDDGPSRVHTPRLLKILRTSRAQATFFVQGRNAERMPALLRAMVRDGHAVENHSWDHPALTTRDNRSVGRQLRLTQRAIRDAIDQRPRFFRPPYGDTSMRVRRIARTQHLRQELWTIDSHDWTGISAKKIRRNAVRGLRKHSSNVILLHDAVGNSGRTLEAVPGIVLDLRRRGYCLVPLEQMMPLDRVLAPSLTIGEGTAPSTVVEVTMPLAGPAQRNGSFHVRSVAGTARAGTDFRPIDRRVAVQRGDRAVSVHLRIYSDPMPNPTRRLTMRLSGPKRLALAATSLSVAITDDAGSAGGVIELLGPVAPAVTLSP